MTTKLDLDDSQHGPLDERRPVLPAIYRPGMGKALVDALYTVPPQFRGCYGSFAVQIRRTLLLADELYLAQADRVWRPIETAPADDAEVLVAINPGPGYDIEPYVTIGRYQAEQRAFQMEDSTRWLDGVTHWMPKPEPPK